MSCFSCRSFNKEARRRHLAANTEEPRSLSRLIDSSSTELADTKALQTADGGGKRNMARSFTFKELISATRNFKITNLIGEGGFGKVFKGQLESGQVVAVKQLNREGMQGTQEFLVECLMLIMLHHPNLVSLIGYCAEGNERILVYQYMAKGSLEDHLFDLPSNKEPLDWNTRMKIAVGAAKGLTYLHDSVNPPVIYRDLKSSNILLDDDFNPKLSDFGLAKLGPVGDNTHVSTRVMGTYGYCAPEYAMTGKLTVKSDVYSFGVVLLELISGRKAFDSTKPMGEQSIIAWSRPYLHDKRGFAKLADPLLHGRFPLRALYQLVVITGKCLHDEAHIRPSMHEVALAINFVASHPYNPEAKQQACDSPSALPCEEKI